MSAATAAGMVPVTIHSLRFLDAHGANPAHAATLRRFSVASHVNAKPVTKPPRCAKLSTPNCHVMAVQIAMFKRSPRAP